MVVEEAVPEVLAAVAVEVAVEVVVEEAVLEVLAAAVAAAVAVAVLAARALLATKCRGSLKTHQISLVLKAEEEPIILALQEAKLALCVLVCILIDT